MNETLPPISEPQFPPNYPFAFVEPVVLKEGSLVLIRPIRPDDAPRLQHGFTHLSSESIYYRFLDATKQLTNEQARRLSNLDYHSQMALVGTIFEDDAEHLVGVARYALRGDEHPGEAETAVIVRDDYQGRGLATLMFARLIRYAARHEVTHFVGTVHQSNQKVMSLIRHSGFPFERAMIEPGVFFVKVRIENPPK